MSIPVFISEVRASATDTVQAGGGAVQILPNTIAQPYYFYVSNKGTAGAGRSLLSQLEASLGTSSGNTWAAVLTTDLKLQLTHNAGGTVTVTLNRVLAWNLGFALAFSSPYPPDPTLTIDIPVPTGAGGFTAPFRSPWLWCPERRVSVAGPQYFDPMVQTGVPSSAGAVARAPSGKVSGVSNGIQVDATFGFKGVEPLYRALPSNFNYSANNPHEREDCRTWWSLGPRVERRVLFWRNKTSLPGSSAPLGDSSIAPPYVEYCPDAALRQSVSIVAAGPPRLVHWDITLGFTLTERGEATY